MNSGPTIAITGKNPATRRNPWTARLPRILVRASPYPASEATITVRTVVATATITLLRRDRTNVPWVRTVEKLPQVIQPGSTLVVPALISPSVFSAVITIQENGN